jgi:hypothetical protein
MTQRLDLDLMITEGAERWRTVGHGIHAAEKHVAAAANDPAALISQAQTAFAFVCVKQEKLQSHLRKRFGIELEDPVGDESRRARIRVVNRERARRGLKTLEDVAEFRDAYILLMTYNTARWEMERATRVGNAAWLAKQANARWWARFGVACPVLPPSHASTAALAAYFYVMRTFPIMYAPLIQQTDEPSGLSQLPGAVVGMLAALVRSQLKVHGRLGGALATEGKPQEVLLRVLPGAVADELGRLNAAAAGKEEDDAYLEDLRQIKDDGRRDVVRVLTNRVARQIEARMAKEASPGPEQGITDGDLEQFEQDETLRQEIAGLQEWTVRALLSEQQKQVHDLDMETDHDTKTIAATLGISPDQVRKVRHDYRVQIRKAAGL